MTKKAKAAAPKPAAPAPAPETVVDTQPVAPVVTVEERVAEVAAPTPTESVVETPAPLAAPDPAASDFVSVDEARAMFDSNHGLCFVKTDQGTMSRSGKFS